MKLFAIKADEAVKKPRISNENKAPTKNGAPEKKTFSKTSKPFGAGKDTKFSKEKKFAGNGKFKGTAQKPYGNNKPESGKPFKKFDSAKPEGKPAVPIKKKDLKKERRQKKLADNYDISTNMKKIWETLRRCVGKKIFFLIFFQTN